MSNWDELLKALIGVLVEYHSEKLKLSLFDKGEKIDRFFKMTSSESMAQLKILIDESQKNTKTRSPLLTYILYIVERLKYLQDNLTTIDITAVKSINDELIQLFINLNQLLKMRDSIELAVNYNGTDSLLYGLITFSRQYSVSGRLLEKNLLSQLNIGLQTTDNTIRLIVTQLVELPFLRLENSALKKQVIELENKNACLLQQHTDLEIKHSEFLHLNGPPANKATHQQDCETITQQPHAAIRIHSAQGMQPNFFIHARPLSHMFGHFFNIDTEQGPHVENQRPR